MGSGFFGDDSGWLAGSFPRTWLLEFCECVKKTNAGVRASVAIRNEVGYGVLH